MEKHSDPISFVLNSINTLSHPVFANQADAVAGGQAKEDFTQHGLIFVFLGDPQQTKQTHHAPFPEAKDKKGVKNKTSAAQQTPPFLVLFIEPRS